jgi:hypothetical protein
VLWCTAALAATGTAQAAAVTVAGTWHIAIEMPGTGALNTGGQAFIASVSCPSAGNCAVGGGYRPSGHEEAFVDSGTSPGAPRSKSPALARSSPTAAPAS